MGGRFYTLGAQEMPFAIREINDLLYYDSGPDSHLTRLNLILPEGVENPPLLLWIGGGAWAYVDRNQEMGICRQVARHGIAVASVGHRLSPALLYEPRREEGVCHPEHIKDIARAFQWAVQNGSRYGYDPENLFVGGFSSGAHLSALLASDKRYLEALGLNIGQIRGIIPVSGGYDIPHYRQDLMEEDPAYEFNHIRPVFGETMEAWVDASPITYIDEFDTPMLMISESDTYAYSIRFEQLLQENGKNHFLVLNAHNETHNSLWFKLRDESECLYREMIVGFIRSVSRESVGK